MKKEIVNQNYDVVFKQASAMFSDQMMVFLGLKVPAIKAVFPTELPSIVANISHTDFIFRLADESLLHLEFQATYTASDIY